MVKLSKPEIVEIAGTPYECTDCRLLKMDIPARKSRLKAGAHRKSEKGGWHTSAEFANNVRFLVITLSDGRTLYVTTEWAAYLLDRAMSHGDKFRKNKAPLIYPHDKRCVEFYKMCKSAFLYGEEHPYDNALADRTKHFRIPYMIYREKTDPEVAGIVIVRDQKEFTAISRQFHVRDLFDNADDKGGKYEFKFGDVIAVTRTGGLYQHFAVYIGNDRVIHYCAEDGDFGKNISVHEAPLKKEFSENISDIHPLSFSRLPGAPVDGNTSKHSGFLDYANESALFDLFRMSAYHLYNPGQTVARARSRQTESTYFLPTNNCEHLALWCKTGIRESHQVNKAISIGLDLFLKGRGLKR